MEQDRPDIVILPPVLLVLALGLAVALEWLVPLDILASWDTPVSLVPGLAIMAVAGVLGVWGVLAFRRAGTHVHPTQPALVIVTDGPYRFTRNPMYLGIILLTIGIGVAASLDWALVLAPIVALVLHFGVVLREEAYLTAKFGAQYKALLAATRRWL
ncbi:MAG: isoprenylcysteine carboxylmethyltransferase family protein [Pseudomonadota bacterium]